MAFTIHSLFFAAYTVLAFCLALVTVAVAVTNRRFLDRRHLWLLVITGGTTLPLFLASAVGSLPGYGFLLPLSLLLPLLCLLATVVSLRSIAEHPFGTKILGLLACGWNLLLAGIYSVRGIEVLFQLDLGGIGGGVLTTFALTQRNIGWHQADTLPIFLYMPVMIPPFHQEGRLPLGFAGMAGFLSSFMICLFATSTPGGFAIANQRREVPTAKALSPRSDLQLSMRVGDGRFEPLPDLPAVLNVIGNTASWQTRIDRAVDYGLTTLDVPVEATIVKDHPRFARLENIARRIRKAGLRLNLVVLTPRSEGVRLHRKKFEALMQEAHWVLGERINPDLLVLFSRPFGPRTVDAVGDLAVTYWTRLVQESVAALQKGVPNLKTAVELQPPIPKARQLFAELGQARSGPSEIRFFIQGNGAEEPRVARVMIELGGWLASNPTHTRLSLIASPPTPLGLGGLDAQAQYMRKLIGFAAEQPLVGSICLGSMIDTWDGMNGYWDNRDIPRPVVAAVYEMLVQLGSSVRGAPGK